MKFSGVSLRTDRFPTVSLDQFQWLKLHTIESMIEPCFPAYRGISWRKNKGKLTWQREKKTQPVEDVYLLTSKNGDFPAFSSHVSKTAGRRWLVLPFPGRKAVVVPLPDSADFSSYATPGRSPKALSCPPGARPRDPGMGLLGPWPFCSLGWVVLCFWVGASEKVRNLISQRLNALYIYLHLANVGKLVSGY